jgi:hypothetical protein
MEMEMTTIRDLIVGAVEEGYIHLTVSLSSRDLAAFRLLSTIIDVTDNDTTTLGDAEQMLLDSLWWVHTLGNTDLSENEEEE